MDDSPRYQDEDYYALFNLPRDADAIQIKKAYRKLAIKFHPDKNPDGHDMFVRISRAYEVLSDEDKRNIYDRFGSAGVSGFEASQKDQEFASGYSSFTKCCVLAGSWVLVLGLDYLIGVPCEWLIVVVASFLYFAPLKLLVQFNRVGNFLLHVVVYSMLDYVLFLAVPPNLLFYVAVCTSFAVPICYLNMSRLRWDESFGIYVFVVALATWCMPRNWPFLAAHSVLWSVCCLLVLIIYFSTTPVPETSSVIAKPLFVAMRNFLFRHVFSLPWIPLWGLDRAFGFPCELIAVIAMLFFIPHMWEITAPTNCLRLLAWVVPVLLVTLAYALLPGWWLLPIGNAMFHLILVGVCYFIQGTKNEVYQSSRLLELFEHYGVAALFAWFDLSYRAYPVWPLFSAFTLVIVMVMVEYVGVVALLVWLRPHGSLSDEEEEYEFVEDTDEPFSPAEKRGGGRGGGRRSGRKSRRGRRSGR